MQIRMSDLMDDCYPEGVALGAGDAALTQRIKADVMNKIKDDAPRHGRRNVTCILLLAAVIYAGASGCAGAAFIPALSIAPVDGAAAVLGLAAYGVLLLIPTFYSIREAILWHSLRSKI